MNSALILSICLAIPIAFPAVSGLHGTPAMSVFLSNGQYRQTIIREIDIAFMEGCETGNRDCPPVIITRSSPADSVLLILPNGGTQSSAYLYSTDSSSPIRRDEVAGERPRLNLTGLADGRYGVRMLSCGVGGGFTVLLKTEAGSR